MAKFKNDREAQLGDKVVGLDSEGKPVSGMLVMIHSLSGRGMEANPDIAVAMSGKLIGDLFAKNFLNAEDVKPSAQGGQPAPETYAHSELTEPENN